MAIGIAITLSVLAFFISIGNAQGVNQLRKDVDTLSKSEEIRLKAISEVVGKVLRERNEHLQ